MYSNTGFGSLMRVDLVLRNAKEVMPIEVDREASLTVEYVYLPGSEGYYAILYDRRETLLLFLFC